MSMPQFYVYKIINQINGKIYIGKSKNPARRFVSHKSIARRKYKRFNQFQAIHAAMLKYGIDNFFFAIISAHATETAAFNEEEILIERLQTRNKKYGYNLTKGGAGAVGRKMGDQQKRQLSESRTGSGNPMYNRTVSFETRKKLSDFQKSRKRKPLTAKHRKRLSEARKLQDSKYRIPNEIKQEVIALWKSGTVSKKQIATNFGLKVNTIIKIIRTSHN